MSAPTEPLVGGLEQENDEGGGHNMVGEFQLPLNVHQQLPICRNVRMHANGFAVGLAAPLV